MSFRSAFRSFVDFLSNFKVLISSLVVCVLLVTALSFMLSTRDEVTRSMLTAGDESAENVLRAVKLGVESQHKDLEFFKQYALAKYEQELKDVVSIVMGQIEYFYQMHEQGLFSEEDARRLVLDSIEKLRYGKNDYIVIYDRNNVAVSHPFPHIRGKDMSDYADVTGTPVLKNMREQISQKGEGLCTLWWTRFGETRPVRKLLYMAPYPKWDWLIGAGVYIDDIDSDIQMKMNEIMNVLKEIFSGVKVAETGYFYLFSGDRKILIHPQLGPGDEADPKNISWAKDDMFDLLMQASETPAVSVRYLWDKPSHSAQYRFAKYSHVEHFEPFDWYIASSVYEDEMEKPAERILHKQMIVIGIIVLAVACCSYLLISGITRPIRLLATETKKIKNFDLDDRLAISSFIHEIRLMTDAISSMKTGLQAFRRYVPAELVRQLIRTGEGARLGGHKKDLTVFFSDITGFTTIAERMSPEDLMVHLSEYFDELTKILSDQKGTVDKYIGDAILAFWGAPVPDRAHAFHACAAALACQETISKLNRKWKSEGKSALNTRIGISTGETVVGNVGSSERINYTVMGDNVNLASRLEGANKLFNTKIIVSGKTYEAVSDSFWLRPLGSVTVKGKCEETIIYELMGHKTGHEDRKMAELCRSFAGGVEAYLSRQWGEACEIFKDLAGRFPSDKPTRYYLSLCRGYRDNPPEGGCRVIDLDFK